MWNGTTFLEAKGSSPASPHSAPKEITENALGMGSPKSMPVSRYFVFVHVMISRLKHRYCCSGATGQVIAQTSTTGRPSSR
jgi:hypothetical protein